MSPIFLSLDEVVEIHQDMIERYGGTAGIRDMGLLQSAVAVPQASFGGEYLHTSLFEMAAATSSTSSRTTLSWTATSGREPWPPSPS